MHVYLGYGFNVYDISNKAWVSLIEKFDNKNFKRFLAEVFKDKSKPGMTPYIPSEEEKEELALDYIEENGIGAYDSCEYLRIIINLNEAEKAGTNYIVSNYDNYLVFDSVRFADDSKRTKYIRTQEDFIAMISRYIPIENITFGNVYEGSEWIDPIYSLD